MYYSHLEKSVSVSRVCDKLSQHNYNLYAGRLLSCAYHILPLSLPVTSDFFFRKAEESQREPLLISPRLLRSTCSSNFKSEHASRGPYLRVISVQVIPSSLADGRIK